jgi:hypothetical protein
MLEAIGSWPGAIWLQQSGTAYLFVNAAHILGIGLLLGSILPLDLRLLGFFRGIPIEVIGPFLARSASTGLLLAILTGLWLFSVKPEEYLANDAFRWKAALLALSLINVAIQRRGLKAAGRWQLTPVARISAGLSLGLWLSVLVAGRWIGFL